MAAPKLSLVDQTFASLPEPADDAAKRCREVERRIISRYMASIMKIARPGIIEEGKQLVLRQLGIQRIEDASVIPELKRMHAEQIAQVKKLHGHGAGWFAATMGLAIAAIAFCGGLWAGQEIMGRGWGMRVSDERIPRAAPPTLEDSYTPPDYVGDRREPGDAPQ